MYRKVENFRKNTPNFARINVTVFFIHNDLNFGVTLYLIFQIAAFSSQVFFWRFAEQEAKDPPPQKTDILVIT